ncbi:MAG: TIGR03808 family TAT-translocated repetitive protein [Salinarimonas sp.]|nr:TIGR03808 family TAT-translocated repetitive protein [Salinarimonas sp.]
MTRDRVSKFDTISGPDRRRLLTAGLALPTGIAAAAGVLGGTREARADMLRDAREFGLQPDSDTDQAPILEAALREAARGGAGIHLPAGRYRIAQLRLPEGAVLTAGPEAVLVQAADAPILQGRDLRRLRLAGFGIAGANGYSAPLVQLEQVADCRLSEIIADTAAGTAFDLRGCGGLVAQCAVSRARTAIFANDSSGLAITGNVIRDCTDNGILVWRSEKGDDGTRIHGNRIERIGAASGGSGEYGNGVNVFRAGGVIVSDNVIRDCAFTAVRNNGGDRVQIIGNNCANFGEVGLFTEFVFEGCIIANNIVESAANGIVSTNFNETGRLAVISGNIVRGSFRRPDPLTGEILYGNGIYAEADAAITGNVVEDVEVAGIGLGYGPYLRDVSASNNVLRECRYGFAVSVVDGVGHVQITGNMISRAREAAVIGLRWTDAATGDLLSGSEPVPEHIRLAGNQAH